MKANNFFEVPAAFSLPFSNCEINQVFLLAVLADVTPTKMLPDGTVVPASVELKQISFRGVNIFQDLCPNQLDAISACVLEQLDSAPLSCGVEAEPSELEKRQQRDEARADLADHLRDVAQDEKAERELSTTPLTDPDGPLGMGA